MLFSHALAGQAVAPFRLEAYNVGRDASIEGERPSGSNTEAQTAMPPALSPNGKGPISLGLGGRTESGRCGAAARGVQACRPGLL